MLPFIPFLIVPLTYLPISAMNSTLKPHLLAEALGTRDRPLSPQEISALFFGYRGFPDAFYRAFRLRCHVSKQYAEHCHYKPVVSVTARNGMTFAFDHKLVHIPILLRIAGRLAYRIEAFDPEGSWIPPFLKGVDENRHLKYITSKVGRAFFLRYLRHHHSLPTIEFGGRYSSTVNFAVLDDLKNLGIDTIVFNLPPTGCNEYACRVANVVIGRSLKYDTDPLDFMGNGLKLDRRFLRTYTVCCELPLSLAMRTIRGRYKIVEELTLRKVRLQVSSEYWYIQGAVEQIKDNVDKLWTCMREHPGAVTVSATCDRHIEGVNVLMGCLNGLAGYVVTELAGCVECKLQKVEGNKKLTVSLNIRCSTQLKF
uniref:Uncharacterized protein n=1 Tax=Panagrellus redivivus TaxID=6233 RepID=A0A7E4VIB9_PANRE